MVASHGTLADVERLFGKQYFVYAKGEPSWNDLEKFLRSEPESVLRPLRQAVQKYPKIVYYTTAWRMTWIYLDENDVVRGFNLAAQ